MSVISARSPKNPSVVSIVLMVIAAIIILCFIVWGLCKFFHRATPPSDGNQSIPLQGMPPASPEPEILVNPPLRTGPRTEDPVIPRGRVSARMHGARAQEPSSA